MNEYEACLKIKLIYFLLIRLLKKRVCLFKVEFIVIVIKISYDIVYCLENYVQVLQ